METVHDLHLGQSLHINNDMCLAIDMLAMTSDEIDDLCTKELEENPFLGAKSSSEEIISNFRERHANDRIDFREHLIEQVRLSSFNHVEKYIAEYLIYSLDDDGLLRDADEVFALIFEESGIYTEWSESVRLRLLHFEPYGCAAITVKEALYVQASTCVDEKISTPLIKALSSHGYHEIRRSALKHIIQHQDLSWLRVLSPRPANAFQSSIDTWHEPDLVLDSTEPLSLYLLKRNSEKYCLEDFNIAKNSNQKTLKKYRDRAYFLLKAMRFREINLLKVGQAIVEYQREWFFENKALKPLSLKHIAERTQLHESSVSRLVKHKELLSSRGLHLLKYFFSQGPRQSDNQKKSATSIKALIHELLSAEDKSNPYSDQSLQQLLEKRNILVARRTVAKYRESLGILSSQERKIFSVLPPAKVD